MVTLNEQYLTEIAKAIRRKNGGSTQYTPEQMATRINYLRVVNQTSRPTQYYITQTLTNTDKSAKSFDVTLQIPTGSGVEYSVFFCISMNNSAMLGNGYALIANGNSFATNAFDDGNVSFKSASYASGNTSCTMTVNVPPQSSQTVVLSGYLLIK